MFKIIPDPTFTADVPLTVPGQKEQVIVGMTFNYKDKAALIDFEKRCIDKDSSVESLIAEIVSGWSGIDTECNAESIKALCANYIMAPSEIITAYNKELVRSKAKN